tara:strand:+ start:2264 stop:3175 length:912 start_codon:yes stop_codon:yes gene_type:complete
MTKIKIVYHFMPWEIDYALFTFSQLKKSLYYIPKDIEIIIETDLNLSNYIINWEKSKLSKEFFIEKYNNISTLLKGYTHNKKIYEGDKFYGHLNTQKLAIESKIDYYITIYPDVLFDERLIAYYCEAIKSIKNKYFIITPQITKMWDSSWDIITNPLYNSIPYEQWQQKDCFDIIYDQTNSSQEIKLNPLPTSKFAGWIDLLNKETYEQLIPIWDEWNGYGGWDYYGMIVTDAYKKLGGDFQQYLLEGQTIIEWTTGFVGHPLIDSYKKFLTFNKTENQGEIFKTKVHEYAQFRIKELIKLGI